MTEVTFDEAKRCPKCGEPGEVTKKTRSIRGNTVHWIRCRNKVCRWLDELYIVEVKPDGTIPVRE